MKLDIPKFDTLKEKIAFMVENKDKLIAQKCSTIKHADGFGSTTTVLRPFSQKQTSNKTEASETSDNTDLQIKAIINTTGIMDSHSDVHVKGIWNKSLKENKRLMHVQEHQSNKFDKIISSGEDLKASVKDYSWRDLGYDADGTTQALVFDSTVKADRNKEMHAAYSKGYVDNHSVGMRYVKLELAVNDKEYEKEKDFWDKHIGDVVNRDDAEKQGYFWVVTEAKVIEGSAVPNGSNPITPTLTPKNIVETAADKELSAIKDWLGI